MQSHSLAQEHVSVITYSKLKVTGFSCCFSAALLMIFSMCCHSEGYCLEQISCKNMMSFCKYHLNLYYGVLTNCNATVRNRFYAFSFNHELNNCEFQYPIFEAVNKIWLKKWGLSKENLPSAVKVNLSAWVEYVGKLPIPAAAALFPPLMKLKSELSPSLVNSSSVQSRQSLL